MRKFFLAFLLFSPFWLTGQSDDSVYWQKNIYPLDVFDDSGFHSFFVLDSVVDDYEFFFSAEEHWRSVNSQIQFMLLTYLHQKAGVRNLILEGGFTYGYLINEYLETGDRRLLKKVLNDIPVCPEDQMDLFRKLYKYNQQLPEEERIMVSGIDLEHSPELALQGLHTLLPEKESPAEIEPLTGEIQRLHYSRVFEDRAVKKLFKKLELDLQKHPRIYADYLGENFPVFELIVENALKGYKFTIIKALFFQRVWEKREEQIYKNFVALQPRMKSGKYFAQFGGLHTDIHQSRRWKFPTLANRLNSMPDSPVGSQVMTISRFFRDMKADYQNLGEHEKLLEMMDYIEENFAEKIVICSMVGKDTPFREMSKTFQYILLLDSSLESEPCK